MKTAHALICLFLALLFPLTSIAAVLSSNPGDVARMLEEYIAETGKPLTSKSKVEEAAKAEYLQGIALQARRLEPEDFNLFLLYLVDRYVKNPSQREILYQFAGSLHDAIAVDLANTEAVENGPADELTSGAIGIVSLYALTAIIGWKYIWANPLRSTAFAKRMSQIEADMSRAKPAYRLPYKIGTNPLILSAAAGAGWAGYQYWLAKNRNYRRDPLVILSLAQANLACDLSYKGLELQGRFEAIRGDEAKLRAEYQDLSDKIQDIRAQSKLLLDQSNQLDNLYVSNPYFQKDLQELPSGSDFQKLRDRLSDMEKAPEGRCHELAWTDLDNSLEDLKSNLDSAFTALPPPAAVKEKTP
jgi:hypothetical protein